MCNKTGHTLRPCGVFKATINLISICNLIAMSAKYQSSSRYLLTSKRADYCQSDHHKPTLKSAIKTMSNNKLTELGSFLEMIAALLECRFSYVEMYVAL